MLGCICIRIWRGYDEKSIRETRKMSNSFTWQYLLMASNLASATREILLLPKNIRSGKGKIKYTLSFISWYLPILIA